MKKTLLVIARIFLGILCAIVLAAAFLVVRWLLRHEDPTAFLPDRYVAYFQVPSIRGIYEEWLNLEVADVVLSRPELAQYKSAVADARGLALTNSPVLKALLDVHADVMLLKGGDLLVVLPLGWRGIFTPLARIVGPILNVKGFSFLNDSGTSMYRYTSGATTIHAAFVNDVAIVSLNADVVKEALARRASNTGLAMKASRELLDRVKLRSDRAVRVLADTQGLSAQLLSGSDIGGKLLGALDLPGQSMMDVELGEDILKMGAQLPISVSMPELSEALGTSPAPIGILRYAPASTYLLSVSNIAPLSVLYRLAAALQGKQVEAIYTQADSGAKTVVGAGIDELLFSWVGAEVGALMVEESSVPVFFARIKDMRAYRAAMDTITKSVVAGKDSSLVLDGVRIDRLSLPWYVKLILDTLGLDVPEPYFITVGDYFFLSLDAQNLAAVSRTADTGDNLARVALFARLAQGIPADASLLVWYDIERTEPFFIRGSDILPDVLRLYGRGIAAIRATTTEIKVTLSAAHAGRIGIKPLAGFPLSQEGGVSLDLIAFRFTEGSAPRMAWLRDRSVLVLADAGGTSLAEARLEADSAFALEPPRSGAPAALWAVSPGGTVWRFGPDLQLLSPFPEATGITGSMPPVVIGGKLALFSKADSTLVLIDADGTRTVSKEKLEAPLFSPPDYRSGWMAFYPKSFESRVHLSDLEGREVPGWPVEASGISFCSPRIVPFQGSDRVTFMTQAGLLYAWTLSGEAVSPFPVQIPGVFYSTPEPIVTDVGAQALVALAQDGALSMISLDGTVLRQTTVPDLDGKAAKIVVADLYGDGHQDILLYGSGAFIAGLDASFRPLPGFPVKGVSRPQVIDLNRDGAIDFVTAGLDGKIYAYSTGRSQR
jgi:hypothetical protein